MYAAFLFRYFDENGDGFITLTEFGNVLGALGQSPSEDELQCMMRGYDDDKNGFATAGASLFASSSTS